MDGTPSAVWKRRPNVWPTWALLSLLLMLPLLAACNEKTFGAGIRAYNHTDQMVGQFTINGGSGGSIIRPHQGGGSLTCCVSIPATWRPGLKATIRWSDGSLKNEQERVVAIPPYDAAGRFDVHFLRNGEIKVFVTIYALWHPDYPLTGREAEMTPGVTPTGPWDD